MARISCWADFHSWTQLPDQIDHAHGVIRHYHLWKCRHCDAAAFQLKTGGPFTLFPIDPPVKAKRMVRTNDKDHLTSLLKECTQIMEQDRLQQRRRMTLEEAKAQYWRNFHNVKPPRGTPQ